jgi:hypothetical protein
MHQKTTNDFIGSVIFHSSVVSGPRHRTVGSALEQNADAKTLRRRAHNASIVKEQASEQTDG